MTIPHVTKDQAISLKELGFDWPSNRYISNGITKISAESTNWNESKYFYTTVPEIALAIMWFRNVHGLNSCVPFWGKEGNEFTFFTDKGRCVKDFKSHPEAESALLDHLIEHLKERR